MRYLHQVENVRPDIDLVSDQLVKARWFIKQEKHFPNVTFPKRRYNEYYFGFTLEEFINANSVKRPVVGMCPTCTPNDSSIILLTKCNIFSSLFSPCDSSSPENLYRLVLWNVRHHGKLPIILINAY